MKKITTLIAATTSILVGCRSGLYQIENQVQGGNGKIPYRVVSSFGIDIDKDDNRLPVEVETETKVGSSSDCEFLWFFTLGLFPAFMDDYEIYTVTVKTPIGDKTGTGVLHAKRWLGWICIIPYPGIAEERDGSARLPNVKLGKKLTDEIIASLVSQFSSSDYQEYVKEQDRIKVREHEIKGMIASKQFEDALDACATEIANQRKRNGIAPYRWKNSRDDAIQGLVEFVPLCEDSARLVKIFRTVNDDAVKAEALLRLDKLGQVRLLSQADLRSLVHAQSESDAGFGCKAQRKPLLDRILIDNLAEKNLVLEIANASIDDVCKLAAIKSLDNFDQLLDLALNTTNKEVIAEAYKKIGATDQILRKSADEKFVEVHMNTFFDVFGVTEDAIAVISKDLSAWRDCIAYAISKGAKNDQAKDALAILQGDMQKVVVQEEVSRILQLAMRSRKPGEFESEKLGKLLSKIANRQMRSKVTFKVIQKIHGMKGKILCYNDWHYVNSDHDNFCAPFIAYVQGADAQELFNLISTGKGPLSMHGCGLMVAHRMPKDVVTARAKAIMDEGKKTINFAGFYLDMPDRDRVLLQAFYDINPSGLGGNYWYEWDGWENHHKYLAFDRNTRYTLFEKEDGDFWSAFLEEFVPQNKKKSSAGEVVRDLFDRSQFDYQEMYDAGLEERCYVYKSLKYHTKVVFGLRSGRLILRKY